MIDSMANIMSILTVSHIGSYTEKQPSKQILIHLSRMGV